jgi:hypothetical protein
MLEMVTVVTTSIKSAQSCTEVPLHKEKLKSETLNPSLLCKACKGFEGNAEV